MSEKSKGDTSSRVVVKNPLLSASVTGLTYDDFPNKPHLLPAAPPAPAVVPTINRDPNPLVTVGTTDIDTESLDEISLNATNEETTGPDANANQLFADNTPDTDSLLSQAASSFSALPSVASSVFSTFSKRIYSGSTSRELTPAPTNTRSTPDPNANLIQPFDSTPAVYPGQSQTQQQYQQQLIEPNPLYGAPPPAQIFGAPPQAGHYYGGLPEAAAASPAPEPPKFYTPTEIPNLPTATAPPSTGQNTYRLSARKKVYAPIPGLSDHLKQHAPTISTSAVNAPLHASQYQQPQQQAKQEERKKGGLFSLTNLVPTGVLQNISGFVQSAAGGAPQSGDSNYFGVTPAPELVAVPQPSLYPFAAEPHQANFFAPPPAAVTNFQPPPQPESYAAVGVEQQLAPTPPYPTGLPTNFPTPPTGFGAESKTSSVLVPQPATQHSTPAAPEPFSAQFPPQVGTQPPQPAVNILNPQKATSTAQTDIPQTNTPSTLTAPPLIGSGSTPPKSAPTSFRLQKGTRLYKNPLTTAETAPARVVDPLGQPPAQLTQAFLNPFTPPLAPSVQAGVDGLVPQNFEAKPSATEWQPQSPQAKDFAPVVASTIVSPAERPVQPVGSNLIATNFETKPPVAEWQLQPPQSKIFAPPVSSSFESQWQPTPPALFNPFAPPVAPATNVFDAPKVPDASNNVVRSLENNHTSTENANAAQAVKTQVEPPQQPAGLIETKPDLSFFEEQIIELPASDAENSPTTAEAVESEKTLDALEETLKTLSLDPSAESRGSKLLAPPPPQVTASQNQSNPYRREPISHGTITSTAKQLNLANFFTPASQDPLAGGDFTFFSSGVGQNQSNLGVAGPQPTSTNTSQDAANFFNFRQQGKVTDRVPLGHSEHLTDAFIKSPRTEAANAFETPAFAEIQQATVGALPTQPAASQTKASEASPLEPATASGSSIGVLLPTIAPLDVKPPKSEAAPPPIPFGSTAALSHFSVLPENPPNLLIAPQTSSDVNLLPIQSNLSETFFKPQQTRTPANFFSDFQPSVELQSDFKPGTLPQPPSAFQSTEATAATHPATANFFTNLLSTGTVTEAAPLNPSIAPPVSSAHFFDNPQQLSATSVGPAATLSFPPATVAFPPLPVFSNTTPTLIVDTPLPGNIPPPLGFEQLLTDASRDTSDTDVHVNAATGSSKVENRNQSTHSRHTFSNFLQEETKILTKPQTQPQLQPTSVPTQTAEFFDTFKPQVSQVPPIQVGQSATEDREDQRIQNFFNNPPPQDNSTGIGELTYDFIHSGLGVKNLEERSTTPFSNLVEPPLSSCSEWSELNISASEQKLPSEGASKLSSPQHSLADGVTPSEPADDDTSTPTHTPALLKHYEDLPEEILKELGMADGVAGTSPPDTQAYSPAIKHWFYKRVVGMKEMWTPFSHYDSALLETTLTAGDEAPNVVAVEGGRYDVHVRERTKVPVYWQGEPIDVRRCSWFYKATDSRYVPYEEEIADLLETEYKSAFESGVWHQKTLISMGEQVVFHGPTVIVHFQRQLNDDAWGGSTQTTTRPRVVKRDLNDFIIEPGESQRVDHLLFMVHGIGAACDLKMRSVEEVVDDFRSIAQQLVQSHYKNSTETGLVGRVEVLPISWHGHLHSDEMGIDDQLKSITLESIPKLRNFTNDTLLDILFYTSPLYCQKIMNTVATSLNTVYLKYRERHPDFRGGVSLGGHSLGSLILFDLLCHQNPIKECEEENRENPDQQFGTLEPASTSNEEVDEHISYTMGAAGTGQPFIHYPQLIFQPKKFFAMGSPIGMFVTIRGIDKLGLDFRLPTCAGFYNIFHPFDPVAYRIEALVNPDMCGARPVLIPHHKGRKRMHLELRDTMTRVGADLKQRFYDKFKNTLDSVNFLSTRSKKEAEEALEKEVDSVLEMQIQLERQQQSTLSPDQQQSGSSHSRNPSRAESTSTTQSDQDIADVDVPLGKLNDSKRIDYVLQEAPLEFFNEYVFALSSHVCYWSSEDTILFVMKEIYSGLGVSPDSQVPQQSMTIERPSSRNSVAMSLLS